METWSKESVIRKSEASFGRIPIEIEIQDLIKEEIHYLLTHFIADTSGNPGDAAFTGQQLFEIELCIKLYLRENGKSYNFFTDAEFDVLKNTLTYIIQ